MHHEEAAQVYTDLVNDKMFIHVMETNAFLFIDSHFIQFPQRTSVYLETCIWNWKGIFYKKHVVEPNNKHFTLDKIKQGLW